MRLKSEFWVHAYIRTCAGHHCPAFVVRHGDDDAGALYIKINHLDGTASLYGPAPAGFDEQAQAQHFIAMFARADTSEADVDGYIARQADYDSDLWLIEVEDAKRRHFLNGWLTQD